MNAWRTEGKDRAHKDIFDSAIGSVGAVALAICDPALILTRLCFGSPALAMELFCASYGSAHAPGRCALFSYDREQHSRGEEGKYQIT